MACQLVSRSIYQAIPDRPHPGRSRAGYPGKRETAFFARTSTGY